LDKTATYTLSGKTGTVVRVAPHVGWFVGYLEASGNVYFFATNIEGADVSGEKAREIARNVLQGVQVLR